MIVHKQIPRQRMTLTDSFRNHSFLKKDFVSSFKVFHIFNKMFPILTLAKCNWWRRNSLKNIWNYTGEKYEKLKTYGGETRILMFQMKPAVIRNYIKSYSGFMVIKKWSWIRCVIWEQLWQSFFKIYLFPTKSDEGIFFRFLSSHSSTFTFWKSFAFFPFFKRR